MISLSCFEKVYWPKREEVGRYLKVECIPVLNGTEFGPVFAISKAVLPGIASSLLVVHVIRIVTKDILYLVKFPKDNEH